MIGRKQELDLLEKLYTSPSFQFLIRRNSPLSQGIQSLSEYYGKYCRTHFIGKFLSP